MVTAVISLNEPEVKILLFSPFFFFAASFGIHTIVLPTPDLLAQTVTHVMNTSSPLAMKRKTFPSLYSIINCLIRNRSYSSLYLYLAPQQYPESSV